MASRSARLALTVTASALVVGLLIAPTADASMAVAVLADPIDILVLGDSYGQGTAPPMTRAPCRATVPQGVAGSRVNWSEKYATALRASGQPVRLVNHACSGGVTADITSPRVMDTASKVEPTPAGVTTLAEADASLAQTDPCNTHAFPDEEFWTYHATAVDPVSVAYDCTRNLRPQANFVNSNVDLVLFTMGGNDAGFSTIVQNCFVPGLRTSSGCQGKVDAARALLPQVRERLLADVTAIRAHGLRDEATMVQLGYPWLQADNNFTLPDPPGYAAGNQVRALVSEGNAAIAAIVPNVNIGHPGQLTFLEGVPEKFSGHEPDATTPVGNPARWINQVGDGDAIEVWYHPNRLGQVAYAKLLQAYGAVGTQRGVRAKMRVRLNPHRVHAGDQIRLRVSVRLSDGSRPRGKMTVRDVNGHRRLVTTRLHRSDHGTVRLTLRLRDTGTTRLRIVYNDRAAPTVRATRRVHVAP